MPKRRASKKKRISAEDLYNLRIAGGIAISPDENQIAFTVERMDKEQKKYFKNIHIYDLEAGEQRQFTRGDQNDGAPVWSHSGRHIAFVSNRDKKTGIYVMSVTGGAERKIIELDGSIARLQWTPDDQKLVFALRYNDSNEIEDEDEKKKPPVYRHITRLFYRLDGTGFLPKDRFQIYSLDVATGTLSQITKGTRDNLDPHVSPDGKLVAYASNRYPNEDMNTMRIDLFVKPLSGGREKKIPTPAGPVASPQFSPDGKNIAYVGHDNPDDEWGVTNAHIWLVPTNGRGKARDLMPGYDRMVYDQSISDMGEPGWGGKVVWSADGRRIYFVSSDTGVTNLFYITPKGKKPTRVYRGDCHMKDFSLNGKTRRVAMIRSDFDTPSDIVSCPAAYAGEKKAKVHTDLNPFMRERKLGKTKEVRFKSFDGTEIQGFLTTPPDMKRTKKYPGVLEIHGGPRAQYAFTFFHEMLYLAAHDYVVFYTNPRGGQGRGETWADAIAGGWGDLDYKDCMAAADYMEKLRYVDGKRLGVTGGSYGGFMTNWIIGHTDRFKAAVTQRSISDLNAFVGSSDIGWELEREFHGYPWTDPEHYKKSSPISYYEKVKTPVLIIHSEQDLRCPMEQAEQMFVKLKVLRKKVELVRFPEEPHGLSRHGRPDRRIARLEWILKWFDRYLK